MARNPSYPPFSKWDDCEHEWKYPMDAMCETEVNCKKCGCPGDAESINDLGDVYWPAT